MPDFASSEDAKIRGAAGSSPSNRAHERQSAWDNLVFYATLYGSRIRGEVKAERYLSLMGLWERAPGGRDFSRGMKQKMAIAARRCTSRASCSCDRPPARSRRGEDGARVHLTLARGTDRVPLTHNLDEPIASATRIAFFGIVSFVPRGRTKLRAELYGAATEFRLMLSLRAEGSRARAGRPRRP